jgi:glucose-1-phosphate thymidylyltransferase
VITNDKFFEKFSKWAAAFKFSVPLQVINDKTTTNENRLGAVRDIEFAMRQERINDDLLVIGGDNLFKFDLKAFVDFAASHRPASSLAVFDIKDKAKASIYGVVKTDPQDKVIGFQEKPPRPDTSLISTCVYYFPREALGLILEYLASGIGQDATGNYIKWLSENHAVYAFSFKERWYDIGDIESYKKADKDYHKD